jgi:ADP-ribosylglycohydrolase
MKKAAEHLNGESLSNGCLMRISPLAIYVALRKCNESEANDFVRRDTQLTHSNPTAIILC